MKIVFVSVVLNIHQVGLADELYKLTEGNYWFIETGDEGGDKYKGGADYSDRPYLIQVCKDDSCKQQALQLIREADVMIYGGSPLLYLKERIRTGKIAFIYSERWLKKGLLNLLSPRLLKQQWFYHTCCCNKPLYALCSSAYAARDFNLMYSFIGKCFKWGYFVATPAFDIESCFIQKRKSPFVKILWIGRLISWKHPEKMIELALKLRNVDVNFQINIIGLGEKYEMLNQQIKEYNLLENVRLLGSLSNDDVKKLMRKHHIACFTSDRNEGWGAVLNEAMGNGCCPVSSIDTGSTPYLIKEGVNGFSFSLQKKNDLYDKVLWLIKHPKECEQMSMKAYETIHKVWSPKCAAENLYRLCSNLMQGKDPEILDGPCSKA